MADGVLGQIVAAKRAELDQRLAGVTLDALRARAVPTKRSLAAAIALPGARFILEIKRASPSAGTIRAAADPADLARGYAGVADGLSVLTDAGFFGGSLADLAAARGAFDGPILAKDFFIDPRQIAEARIAGADAVLVMLSVLDDAAARTMITEARRLGLDALIEVHDETEMRRALTLDAPLIGINNRDLRDLSIDLATTQRLAPLARGRRLISESGIASRADVDRLSPTVDGFLIGSALMRAAAPAQAARALIFRRVKLCGLNRAEDVAAAAPAAFAGFVFAAGSPRQVSVEQAAPLAGEARRRGMLPVGIVRDAPVQVVSDVATMLNLAAVQLHGNEDSDYIARLRRELPHECEIWTAVSVGRDVPERAGGDRLLFDNGAGGTGQSFNWEAVRGHPAVADSVIAGGLGPSNARAAAALGAFAIDVGSRVDAIAGVKSAEKIAALFEALR
ncbi:MAG: bifunctional indole-3-glycerol-phosphate synthase TrpC/phosphoribosylanthranilate isomerase TrpF, partial [Sphingomicrobium sp.]